MQDIVPRNEYLLVMEVTSEHPTVKRNRKKKSCNSFPTAFWSIFNDLLGTLNDVVQAWSKNHRWDRSASPHTLDKLPLQRIGEAGNDFKWVFVHLHFCFTPYISFPWLSSNAHSVLSLVHTRKRPHNTYHVDMADIWHKDFLGSWPAPGTPRGAAPVCAAQPRGL